MFDELWARYPTTTLTACGRAVGLPDGQMGNSEVGHLNLGAGSVVMQDLTRIDAAAADGAFARNPALRDAFAPAPAGARDRTCLRRRRAFLDGASASADRDGRLGRRADLVVHAFTDGRDTLPHAGAEYLQTVAAWLADAGVGSVGSVVGRYYAMDRDQRWDRVKLAYDLLVHGVAAHRADTAQAACGPPMSATRPTSSSRRR